MNKSPIWVTLALAWGVATVGRAQVTMVQINTNALGQDILGDAANEPSLAVNPNNPNQMAVGWRQFDTVTSDFRQAGVAYTTNGGQTWTSSVLAPGQARSDPVLRSDADGNFYYSSISVSDFSAVVFKSTNGGATWGSPVNAVGGDKQWIAIDKTTGPGRWNIYQDWNVQFTTAANTSFTRSTNGGVSFDSPTAGTNSLSLGTMSVGPTGTLYAAGAGGTSDHVFAKSTNAQFAGQTPTFTGTQIDLGGQTTFGIGPVNPGG